MPRTPTDTATRLALTLEFESAHRLHVTDSSTVRLTSDRLIGEPVVDIVPAPGPPLREGDTLYAREIGSLQHVMAQARALKASLDSLMLAVHSLGAGASLLENMDRLQRGLAGVQAEFTALSATLRAGPGFMTREFTASLDRLTSMAAAMSAAFDAAAARHRASATGAAETFARLQRGAATISAEAAALAALQNQAGIVARLRTDSALVVALRGVRAQLDTLIAEARRNPLRFVY